MRRSETVRNTSDWERVLSAVGVRAVTAILWAPIFAADIDDETFSAGERDLADFLPTVLHESGMLERLAENGNYSAGRIREIGLASKPGTRWRSLVPRANELAGNPARFFEACYGGRMGNGPEGSGDGARYYGRGLIMLTGKDNYRWQGDRSGQDLLGVPDLAAQPHFALGFAIDWWEGRVPDRILGDDRAIRRVVNGGYIGLPQVEALAALCQRALS
jgi:putative chitinase